MNHQHHAASCRLATPTLFLAPPFWFEAEGYPWSCVRRPVPRLLSTTEVCANCPFWQAHPAPTRTSAKEIAVPMLDRFGALQPHETI